MSNERKEISLKDFIFASFDKQHEAWYDWFCSDRALFAKTKKLSAKVRQIAFSPRFNPDKVYIFFKNNCPCIGPLYDDFRICDIESGDVIYTVTPRSGHTGKAEVWGKDNNFKEPIVQGTWKDVLNFFKK